MKKLSPFLFLIILTTNCYAEYRVVNLSVQAKQVNFTGEAATALSINDQIPAPTLHFKDGDEVTINVHNKLDVGTSIHWHGILLPWQMDGVEGVTQAPIKSGETFSYKFKIKQSGTYWYHAHSGFQEQQGLYGAMIIDPATPPKYKYDKDFTVVLSDWSNTDPEQIFSNLKKKGDFYTPNFPIQPSLSKFITDYQNGSAEQREKLSQDYAMMQQMRMSIFDFSDVAYDAFLLNGTTKSKPWAKLVKKGDVVRLRFVGAGGSTKFQVKIPGAKMKVIHVQGNDVEPHDVEDFTISPGETTDVLVKITEDSPYIIYAESSDTLGAAYGALVTSLDQKVPYTQVASFPKPGPVHMGHDMHMDSMESMDMTMGTKYQDLKSAFKTNDPDKPVIEIRMDLYGYMDKYVWFINGLMEHEAEPIVIEPGKRYRFIFNNSSMMTHPMHLHGHFFILRNGHDEYDPLMHTIEVAPGATVVADFDADTSGQWFFHCHHLFHMMSGMARVFQYANLKPTNKEESHLVHHPMAHPSQLHQATFLDLGYDPFHNVQKGNLNFMIGWDYDKLQLYSEDAEVRKGKIESADLDIFYWLSISEFWAIKGGVNYVYKPAHKPYIQPGIGVEGTMPYFIETNLRSYLHKDSLKIDLQLTRDTQITDHFFVRTGLRGIIATKDVLADEIGTGLNKMEYVLRPYLVIHPNLSVFSELNHTQTHGALKRLLQHEHKSTKETVLTFGISILR